jgi:hypothetical protein
VEEIRKELVRRQAAKEEPQQETWVQEHNEEKGKGQELETPMS